MRISLQETERKILMILSDDNMRLEVNFTHKSWSSFRDLVNQLTEKELKAFAKISDEFERVANGKLPKRSLKLLDGGNDGKT